MDAEAPMLLYPTLSVDAGVPKKQSKGKKVEAEEAETAGRN